MATKKRKIYYELAPRRECLLYL